MTETTDVKAGWLIDGTGDKRQRDVLLSIQKDKIAAVNCHAGKKCDAVPHFDLSSHTVIPGLVDSHVHLAFDSQDQTVSSHSADYNHVKQTVQRNLRCLVSCGVVAIRDGGDPHGYVKRYKAHCPRNNQSCQIHAPGHAWHKKGRYGGFIGTGIADEKDLIRNVQKEISVVDHVKIINSGLNSLTEFRKETPSQFSRQTLTAVCDMARRAGVPVMVHANGEQAVSCALAAGCQSIEHGYFMGGDNLRKMAEKQVTWVPTVVPMKYFADTLSQGSLEAEVARRTLDDQLEQLYRAREYGVPVAVGTDAGCPGVAPGVSVSKELNLFFSVGFGVEEIIQSVSKLGAQLINADQLGTIAPGKAASFLAVMGTPDQLLAQLPEIDFIMICGSKVDIASDC